MGKKEIIYNSEVAVVGFGRAGQAMVRYLHQSGAAVRVSDLRRYDELSKAEQALLDECGAVFEGGEHRASFLEGAELVVVSPGVDYRHLALVQARKSGARIAGELAVAAGRFDAPVIAVTGTNGKTTVTELIGALFAAAGKNVFVGGNIGTPIGEYLLSDDAYDAVVLEVSSFQLELCGDFAPDVGILLNISPDHLDRHGTLENYAAAKMNIFGGERTYSVSNGDDPLCRRFADDTTGLQPAWFGHDAGFDAAIDGGRIVVRQALVYDLEGSKLDNLSGRLNSAAALLGLVPFNLDPQCIQAALKSFEPGEHRLHEVDRIDGVVFINDSKATNTGAVKNAIMQVGGAIILIAGGRDKGDDYALLRNSVAAHVKHLMLIGEAAHAIGAILGDLAPVDYPATLEDAVTRAAEIAEPGDRVLLSPACASFDMFDNYQQRGRCFIDAVQGLRGRTTAAGTMGGMQ